MWLEEDGLVSENPPLMCLLHPKTILFQFLCLIMRIHLFFASCAAALRFL